MKRKIYSFITLLFLVHHLWAQDKLLYTTDFTDWAAITTYTSESTVTKTTDFSGESLVFKLYYATVDPLKYDNTRFAYTPADVSAGSLGTAGPASKGAVIAQKTVDCYIQTSPLSSITKVEFVEGATGSSRGYKVWKKNATDADWVSIYTTPATPTSGQTVTVTINDVNVALKFTNIAIAQNAYMFSLKIYGNYVSPNSQFMLNTSLNIDAAGTITRTPNSDKYDQGSVVSLKATPNFGYKFVKWTDGSDNYLSTTNPYPVTMDADKTIKAVFAIVNTYTFEVTKTGSTWGEVQLTPLPKNGRYEEGTQVSMKVVPNPVTNFSYWEDNSTLMERLITVDGNKSFTATFDEIPFIVGWNFKVQTPTQSRVADFYSETTNTGNISSYDGLTGNPVGWLANTAAFSPAYPNIRFWTAAADFTTNRRYLTARFSTVGYKNIQVKSMVGANYQAYSVMTLLYSLNDTNFTELSRIDITDVYNTGWKDMNVTLPADAEGQTTVYLKWKADETSANLGDISGNDGTAFTNIYIFADKVIVEDHDAPLLVSSVPVKGSATASITGAVVLTFNEKVKAGTGNITLGSSVITGTFGSKTATFKYDRLSYDTEYKLNVPAGALTDLSGNPFAGDTITFRTGVRAEPSKKLFDAVVAKDGSGDYISIIDAIAAAPSSSGTPWLIYVKNGKYTGHHDIPSTKPFIHLIGQYRDSVIISDNRLCGDAGDGTPVYPVLTGATTVVNSTNCYFENITFENSWGYEKQAGPQALALYTLNDHIAFKNCYMRSYQDTYLTSYNNIADRHYLLNCKIEGAVDFIYGGGDVFFDNCNITCMRKDGGYIVAPSHKTGTLWGYVFSNCTVDGASNVTTYFGRPWQNAPKAVFLNTTLKVSVYPVGWYYKMGAIPAVFADYGTMNATGNPVDLSQRISNYEYDVKDANGNVINTVHGTAQNSLTDDQAATYTYENVILRGGDTWDPRMIAEAPAKPVNVKMSGSVVSWDNVAYSRLYIVFRNNNVLGFTTDTHFSDNSAVIGASYAVQAVSEFGALSETTSASVITTKLDQNITITAVPPKTYGDDPFSLTSTVNPSGYEVAYSIVSGPATISGNVVTIKGAGDIIVMATQSGDANYNAANSSITINVQKAVLTVTAIDTSMVKGTALPVFLYKIEGLKNNDLATVVSGKPELTTSAPTDANTGKYPITVARGTLSTDNYTFQLISGSLTITENTGVQKAPFAGATIYPNPVKNGLLYILLPEKACVTIYSVKGDMIYSNDALAGKSVIDFSKQAKGIYLLKVTSANGTSTFKVEKE